MEDELFNEENNNPRTIINIKRISKKNDEFWKISKDNKEIILKKEILTINQREFLRTPEGMIFLIEGFKSGWNSVPDIKKHIEIKFPIYK